MELIRMEDRMVHIRESTLSELEDRARELGVSVDALVELGAQEILSTLDSPLAKISMVMQAAMETKLIERSKGDRPDS